MRFIELKVSKMLLSGKNVSLWVHSFYVLFSLVSRFVPSYESLDNVFRSSRNINVIMSTLQSKLNFLQPICVLCPSICAVQDLYQHGLMFTLRLHCHCHSYYFGE